MMRNADLSHCVFGNFSMDTIRDGRESFPVVADEMRAIEPEALAISNLEEPDRHP